ncbi:hypothetical protein BY996DRAFT_4011121 [Phakopsora pachyrhizi]|nr:hypothetical protein BY996DRAFT_4011121 [Phakopsora pachyrhizi]
MIIIINTSLLHTMLLLTIVTMLIINITTNEQPEPTVVCFIMAMNILRPSVAYFNLATAMARENCKSYESYPSSIIYGNSESQNKIHKAETAGNVMKIQIRYT